MAQSTGITTFFLYIALHSIAVAQVKPPPQVDTISETGVSYHDGAFNYDAGIDLSIGGGEFPGGLTLRRSYQSTLDPLFSQGLGTQGWTINLLMRVNNSIVLPLSELSPVRPGRQKFLYSVVMGTRRIGFYGGSSSPTGGPVGTYRPVEPGPHKLTFTGTSSAGYYTFVDIDGTTTRFLPGTWAADLLVNPDGTTLKFGYYPGGLLANVISSRGYAIIFELDAYGYTKACAINLSVIDITNNHTCPNTAAMVRFGYTSSTNNNDKVLLSEFTNSIGLMTRYRYVGMDHLGCIVLPGASNCLIENTYSVCHRDPNLSQDPPQLRSSDQVLTQTLPDGRSFSYSFDPAPQCPRSAYSGSNTTRSGNDGLTSKVTTGLAGIPFLTVDKLGRSTHYTVQPSDVFYGKVSSITRPEGDKSAFQYLDGLLTQRSEIAKDSSGLSNIISSAIYPSSCVPATCAKPLSTTDALGNVSTFTYDSLHGGVLTETGPANGAGVRAVVRHEYAQRRAWIISGGGSYVPAGGPIWVKTATRTCRTTATSGNGCTGGAADEVVTTYDYGPDTGAVGNNLLLRGVAVTADGAVQRTCYGYDVSGNRLSETKPRAGLGACS